MISPEKFLVRASLGMISLAVTGCSIEVGPAVLPDHASAGVISAAPPEPEATSIRPAFLKTEKGFILGSPGWHLFNNKLGFTNWSGTGLEFNTLGLERWFGQCAINEFPGLMGVKFVKNHHRPYPVEVAPGVRDVSISIAIGALRDEIDINADFIAGLCMGVEVSRQYQQGGHILLPERIRDRVRESAKDFREAIQTGQIPRVITIPTLGN